MRKLTPEELASLNNGMAFVYSRFDDAKDMPIVERAITSALKGLSCHRDNESYTLSACIGLLLLTALHSGQLSLVTTDEELEAK